MEVYLRGFQSVTNTVSFGTSRIMASCGYWFNDTHHLSSLGNPEAWVKFELTELYAACCVAFNFQLQNVFGTVFPKVLLNCSAVKWLLYFTAQMGGLE